MRSTHVLRELPDRNRAPVLTRRMKAVVGERDPPEDETRRSSSSSSEGENVPFLVTSKRFNSMDSNQFSEESQSLPDESSLTKATNSRIGWVKRAWTVHFFVAIAILGIGMRDNHRSRKYIPIFPPTKAGSDCDRAFLNVMAHTETEPDAIICCRNSTLGEAGSLLDALTSICPSELPVRTLPLAHRLSKFPEAWYIPLFPIVFRMFYMLYQKLIVSSARTSGFASVLFFSFSLKRLCLYIVLLNFRGWVLYVFFNAVEDSFRKPVGNNCWYNNGMWLRSGEESCLNKAFDFSDHVVLYYAQILAISLVETIYAFQYPYWQMITEERETAVSVLFRRIRQTTIPILLAVSHLYLQFITAAGAYKTAAYFHTPGEVVAGFGVSLVVAVPLMLLQSKWEAPRAFFFRYHP